MESKTKFLGHPLHPMLMVFPMGLLIVSLLFDALYLASGVAGWAQMAFWLVAVGVVTGVFAAVPGIIDYMAIPRHTRARRVGTAHGLVNGTVLLLFAVTWGMRVAEPLAPTGAAIGVSAVGVVLLLVGGWLGGELVDRLGVGVDDEANLDAPSALSRRRASDTRARRRAARTGESETPA
jgi:uncharacterized membrane protein